MCLWKVLGVSATQWHRVEETLAAVLWVKHAVSVTVLAWVVPQAGALLPVSHPDLGRLSKPAVNVSTPESWGDTPNPSTQEAETEDCHEFMASLGYSVRPCLKTK